MRIKLFSPLVSNGVKFILILSLFFLFSGSLAEAAENCLPLDWTYTLNIGNLDIDKEKLASFCTEKTCGIEQDFITIGSHFNPDAALIVKDSEVITRLPYKIDSLGLIMSYMNPDDYYWQASIKVDLTFLKHNGILEIEGSEIEKIAELAGKGENIFYCQGEWKQLGSNCRCDNDKEACFECEGALPLAISIPEDLMPYDLAVKEPVAEPTPEPLLEEENQLIQGPIKERPIYYYFVLILFLISAVSAIIIKYKYAKNKKTLPKENI